MELLGVTALAAATAGALKLYLKATTGTYRIEHDLSDKVFIVTGATNGIGLDTALELARHGGTVHLACRNFERARMLADDIKNTTGNARVHAWELELSSLKSVRQFAAKYLASGQQIHCLINNAGVGGFPSLQLTEDGFEKTMATNHFGPFLLTMLLLDRIKDSAPSRIVNVSSMVHRFCWTMPLDSVNFEKDTFYTGYSAYCRSKLANVLFTRELKRRLGEGTNVGVYSIHPGCVRTNLFHELRWYSKPWLFVALPFYKTSFEGAQTTLYVATSPDVENESGEYYADCQKAAMSSVALDDDLCRKFFDLSAKLMKL